MNEVRACKNRERWAKNVLEWENSTNVTNLNRFYQTKSQKLSGESLTLT